MTEQHPAGQSKPHYEIEHDGDLVIVTFPTGRVDGRTVTNFYAGVPQLFAADGVKLLVDLTGVKHISSGGVGIMITLQNRCYRHNAELHLAIPSQSIREVFETMKLDKVLEIFPDAVQARKAFE